MIASAVLLAGSKAGAAQRGPRPVNLVLAPSNLGLRPPKAGHEPGTWRAPQTLVDAGLEKAVGTREVIRLERPRYQFEAQDGTRLRNGNAIRKFSVTLADKVRDILHADRFPVVIGGDCSILLGCLYGARQAGGRGLVHVDGHSDFTQEKSYATPETLGAVAGMDLAIASGRGEPLLTEWPGIDTPLAADADIVQIGERGTGEPWFMQFYGDILKTGITRITAQEVHAGGVEPAARKVIERLEARDLDRAWLHVDLDVLDQAVMPAVDSPGSPGFDYTQLAGIVGTLAASGRIAGANFTIYDPELDPGARHAPAIVACIADGIGRRTGTRRPSTASME